jgi:Zn-dependent protease
MFLGEPPPTNADLHFRLFGFPVRVHPYFWVATLLLGIGGGSADLVQVLVWVAVVLVSIIVHELGHAFVQRYYGGHPWITLNGLGGLASCNDCDRSPRSQIIISLAGPIAGFLFAAAVIAGLRLAGRRIGVTVLGIEFLVGKGLSPWNLADPFAIFDADYLPRFTSRAPNLVVFYLLYVNILWGLVNLLPVYPLDGGQVARELFTLGNPRRGIIQSLWLSTGSAGVIAVYALTQQSFFACVMFAILAYESFRALRAYQEHWR